MKTVSQVYKFLTPDESRSALEICSKEEKTLIKLSWMCVCVSALSKEASILYVNMLLFVE